jgi:hydroxypyruvate reductase
MEGGHPIPNQRSIEAGRAALELASKATPDDVLICLISGGGSALACAPVEGVDLDDLQRLNAQLLASGAGIEEINALRRQVDKLKGGGLAAGTRAQVVALVLSDVMGNAVQHVASGPTALDVQNPEDPLAVQRKYSIDLPAAASRRTGLRKIGQTTAADGRVRNFVIGDVQTAARAALAQAEAEGFQGSLIDVKMRGEARQIGMQMGSRLADLASNARSRPFCLIGAGETTVSLQGKGRGGRNQEMALAAVETLTGAAEALLITLATDGEDGPTDAAGAVVTGETLRRGRELGLQVEEHLAENNSYSYFDALGDLLRTGPTGTNVSDLVLLAGR